MQYQQYTAALYNQLVAAGYKYICQGYEHLEESDVGYPEGSPYAHYEVTPMKEEPIDFNMDKGAYYDITSPEAVDFMDDCYDSVFWVNKKYL